MAALVPPGIRHERSSTRKSGSTLQKIAQKKEQLRHYPRVKKLERIATHLHCEVENNHDKYMTAGSRVGLTSDYEETLKCLVGALEQQP